MSKRLIFLMLTALLSLAIFTACTSGGDAGGDNLPGSNWNLTALNGSAPVAGTSITLNFDDNLAAFGTDGCNNYRTAATVDGENIKFEPSGAATLMACEEPIMTQATAYMAALLAAETFTATETDLVLMDSAGTQVATFAAVSQGLSGTSWVVTNYNNGREAVVGVITDTELTISFGADGQISGTAGCNSYFASYESDTDAGTLTISEVGSSMMACEGPEGIMEQEQEFLAALATAATYSVQGNTLEEIRTADDALALMANKAP